MKREHVGAVLISLMACATMAGSVSGLVHFAEIGKAGTLMNGTVPVGTIAFVAGLDGLAISLTILAHRKGATDWTAFGGLVVATLASTALQVAAVWDQGPAAIIVHGSPAPCTGVAAYFLLRSLGHTEGELPPPPSADSTGGLIGETPTSELDGATAGPPPATEVPRTSGTERRPTSSAPVTQGSGGRKGRGRQNGPGPLPFEELVQATARRLMEDGRSLSKRQVEAAVREISGSCSRETRDRVHEALLVEDVMSPETSGTSRDTQRDPSHSLNLTLGDHDVS